MGQDKKQLTKLLQFVKDLYDHPDNQEFAAGIQDIVLNDLRLGGNRENWTKQINEIYELCLRKNLREQAEDLYKDFPIIGITEKLVVLYVNMENARRANDFDSFGRYLFLQIELIVGAIIREDGFKKLYERIRKTKPLTRYDREARVSFRVDYVPKKATESGIKDTVDSFLILSKDNYGKPIETLGAIDKCRIVIYTICHGTKVSGPVKEFETISAIYNVRNHESHTGGDITEVQRGYYERLITDKTKNYLRFLGFLLDFIKGISSNYPSYNNL